MQQMNIIHQGAGVADPNCSLPCFFPTTQPLMNLNHVDSENVNKYLRSEPYTGLRQPLHARLSPITNSATNIKLVVINKGLALTLGGSASGNHV
jgi:hypothetical protein